MIGRIQKWLMALGAAAALGGCATAPTIASEAAGQQERIIIRNVNVVPMDEEGVLPRRDVVIEGNRIAAIASGGSVRTAPGDRVIEAAGKYLIPALSDMHVHLSSRAGGERLNADGTGTIVRSVLPRYVGYGIARVRDPAIRLDVLRALREATNGRENLPRLVASGPILEGSRSRWSHDQELNVTTPDEGRAALASLAEAEVDFVKVYNRLSPESFDAIAAEARRRGLPIAGHVPFAVGTDHATQAGMRAIEHLYVNLIKDCTDAGNEAMPSLLTAWMQGGYEGRYNRFLELYDGRDVQACEALFQRLGERGVFVTPVLNLELPFDDTFGTDDWDSLHPDGIEPCRATLADHAAVPGELRQRMWRAKGEMLRALIHSGVGLMAGADTPLPCQSFGRSVHKELQLMVRAGLTPLEALRAATLNPARYLGEEDAGVVRRGARADLLLLEGDPTADIRNTLAIGGMVLAGRWHGEEQLARMRGIETNRGIVYENARVWTGTGFAERDVAVRGDRFVPVSTAGTTAERIDLAGRFMVPAYANAHAHLTHPTEERSRSYLDNGVFYVWNPNTVVLSDEAQEFYRRSDTFDVRISQGGITEPGGHPEKLYVDVLSKYVYRGRTREWFLGNAFHYGRDREEIDAALDRLGEQGADFVKAYLLHSEEYATRRNNPEHYGYRGLNPVNFPYLVTAARARDLPVVVHVETAHDLSIAALSGAAAAAHLPGYAAPRRPEEIAAKTLSREQAERIAATGILLTPTYAVAADQYREADADEEAFAMPAAEFFALQARNIRLLRQAGAVFLIGTDTEGPIFEEAEHLVRIGALDDSEAASIVFGTGRRIFPDRRIGCFDAGCEADFLVLGRDPTNDIRALRAIERRIKAGRELPLAGSSQP